MTNPGIVECPAEVWTRVAYAITAAKIDILKTDPEKYLQTYRDSGGVAPVTDDEGVPFCNVLHANSLESIDVYIMPVRDAGRVRVGEVDYGVKFAPRTTDLEDVFGNVAEPISAANRTIIDDTGVLQSVPIALHSANRHRLSGGVYFDTHSDGSTIHPFDIVDGQKRFVTKEDYVVGIYPAGAEVAHAGNWYSTVNGGEDLLSFGDVIAWALEGTHFNDFSNQIESSVQNKCTNYNANPQAAVAMGGVAAFIAGTTNMSAFDAGVGALFGVVAGTAALAAAGLAAQCPAGLLYKLDNTGGSSVALITVTQTVGNTNPHSLSGYLMAGAGSTVTMQYNGGGSAVTSTDTDLVRVISENATPVDVNRAWQFSVPAGGVGYFILNKIAEEVVSSSDIVTAGSAVTRGNMLGAQKWNAANLPKGPKFTWVLDLVMLYDSGALSAADMLIAGFSNAATGLFGFGSGSTTDIKSTDGTNTTISTMSASSRGNGLTLVLTGDASANELILGTRNSSLGESFAFEAPVPFNSPLAGVFLQLAQTIGINNVGFRNLPMGWDRAMPQAEIVDKIK